MASKAHFIGIAGAGMSATAQFLMEKGWRVTGTDAGAHPPVSTYLDVHHIPYATRYAAENIPKDADVIVIGKHAGLVPAENEEVRAAFESGIPVKSFPEVLRDFLGETTNIVVAGSHGKSTCASLIAWILASAGKQPSYVLGAIPFTPSKNGHAGKGNYFVLEGDEYPSANWDTTSKFLYYKPSAILLTSLTHDHLNVYPTHDSYIEPFKKLVGLLPEEGKLVVCVDDAAIRDRLEGRPSVRYGVQGGAWKASHIEHRGGETRFRLVHNGNDVALLATTLFGNHNIENIVGASALLLELGAVTPQEVEDGVRTFLGLARRLDALTQKSEIPVYEGFGSSHSKAKAAIAAMRARFPERELLVVFEPHAFSWRNRAALHWYDDVFDDADQVFIYKPPVHGAATHAQLALGEIVERASGGAARVEGFGEVEEGIEKVQKALTERSALLLLSSGDMGGIVEPLVRYIERAFPKRS